MVILFSDCPFEDFVRLLKSRMDIPMLALDDEIHRASVGTAQESLRYTFAPPSVDAAVSLFGFVGYLESLIKPAHLPVMI